jgi:hypothetical protein
LAVFEALRANEDTVAWDNPFVSTATALLAAQSYGKDSAKTGVRLSLVDKPSSRDSVKVKISYQVSPLSR